MKRIPVAGPSVTSREVEYVRDAAQNAWYQDAGVYNERFERAFAKHVGTRHAVSLPSCTSALHLALLASGVGPGDEVIVPDVTWIATAAPISYVGATPVFADIDASTWCLSTQSVEDCLSARTRAVIPVDLYGGMPDWGGLGTLAEARDIILIEDAAEAIGSRYRDCQAGSLGHVGTFSFHGSKTVTTGEGGMLVTDSTDVWERVLALRDHGRQPGDVSFFSSEVAFKYKMSSLQAAFGLAQVERLPELVEFKRRLFSMYTDALDGLDGVQLNPEPEHTFNTFWMVTVVVSPEYAMQKEEIIRGMSRRGVDCRPFFYPLSAVPAFRETSPAREASERNVVSYGISPYGVNLPSGFNMTEPMVLRVCESLQEVLMRLPTAR